MGGECRVCPLVERAFGGAGNELQRTVVDEADDLRARSFVEPPARKNLCDLLAKLAIAL